MRAGFPVGCSERARDLSELTVRGFTGFRDVHARAVLLVKDSYDVRSHARAASLNIAQLIRVVSGTFDLSTILKPKCSYSETFCSSSVSR